MRIFSFFLFFVFAILQGQVVNKTDSNTIKTQDSLVVDSGENDSIEIFKPTIEDYKFQKEFGDFKILDTALTKEKTYIYSQYNNKDNFGKIQFANIGSGFNMLTYETIPEQNLSVLPTNKSHNILGISDIIYYDVKTPTTTFIFHNGVRNGAALKSTYTQNFGKRFNFSAEYMGLRSQGFYDNSLASNNNTLFTGRYISKNSKYEAYAHFLHQNVNNEEYGGIEDLELFLSGNDTSDTRQNLIVNLEDAHTTYKYRRYYLVHQLTPFNSEKFPFKIRHQIFHQGNRYDFRQSTLDTYFYDASTDLVTDYALHSGKYSKNLSNTLSLVFDKENFKLDAGVRHQSIKAGVSPELILENLSIPGEIKENRIGAVGNLKINLWDKVDLVSHVEFSRGNQFGTFLRTANVLEFEPINDYTIEAKVNFQSTAPGFNYLFNSSVYREFNYYFNDFENQSIMEIGGKIGLKWFDTQIFANYFRIDNFTYFDSEALPQQSENSVNISQIGGDATFHYKKFHLNTRLLFQNTLTEKSLFPAPNFIGRANLYYQTKAFKNAAEIQGGIKAYYFTEFDSRRYSPILNEFILPGQNSFSIGGKPIVDAYVNLKVKRMTFFIEGQHLTNTFSDNKIFTAPDYPFYDFRVNIGIVWYIIH